MKYQRLVDIFVKPDLRDKIRELKREQTYDEFLRDLIKNGNQAPQRRKAQALGRHAT